MTKSPNSNSGIEARILTIRGQRVMLDADLAELYGVETRALKQAVKRNGKRFPESFAFTLTRVEVEEVITVCDNPDRFKFSPALPLAFTEKGVLMLANVLRSERAVDVSIQVIEAFVKIRAALLAAPDLAKKITEIEGKLAGFQDQLDAFQGIVLPLLTVHQLSKRKIGFTPRSKG